MNTMNTKNRILELLEKSKNESLSGEKIAELLDISRNAVWKAINVLKKDGYKIEAVNNRGYRLSTDNNILSVAGINPYLASDDYSSKIHIYKSLESTNKTAKEMAVNDYEHGTIVIADTQTSGRGRRGRSFYSPPGTGLYMSIILRSGFVDLPDATLITAGAAVVVCKAIKAVTGKEPAIKWVNDVFLDNKKICGILTEAVTDIESNSIQWFVVGIGINISTDSFPNDLNQAVTSLFPVDNENARIRNRLAAEIINIILTSNDWVTGKNLHSEYKSRLMLLGRRIIVTEPNKTYEALALDIDENNRLIIKKDNNETTVLSSGEVSVKNI